MATGARRHGRTRSLHAGVAISLVLASGCNAPPGPPPPLPPELHRVFVNQFDFALHPLPDGPGTGTVEAYLTYSTTRQVVNLMWIFQLEDTRTEGEVEEVQLAWQPTAACPEAGAGPRFFVAGYDAATGDVVVERWTAEDVRVGSTPRDPPREGRRATLEHALRRDEIVRDARLGPLRWLVFHWTRRRLWALEERAPHSLWEIDPQDGARERIADADEWKWLAETFNARAGMVRPTAIDGGGFLLMFPDRRAGSASCVVSPTDPPPSLWLLRDADLDGDSDELTHTDYGELVGWRDYPSHEDVHWH